MQIEKSKRLVGGLLAVCDGAIDSFYLAATSGIVSNKMSCIEFSFRMIYETSRVYNVLSRDVSFLQSVNSTMQTLTPDVESVERAFGVMFNSTQQYRLHLKAWQDGLE